MPLPHLKPHELTAPPSLPMKPVCPSGSQSALKAAISNSADDIYLGFRDATSARNFAGRTTASNALLQMQPLMPDTPFNGFRHGRPCLAKMVA